MAARAVRCIVGFNMGENDGCTEVASTTCPTCNAICCAFHQAHDLHKELVSETALLKQQQARAQQKTTSRAGVPDVAPSKESTSEGGTSATKQVRRKNTWADLEVRYQQIKGEAYVRPPKQKRSEFQLMVEGLEARIRGQQEPAQAKDQIHPPINNLPPVAQLNGLIPESMINGFQLLQQLQQFFTSPATSAGILTSIPSQAKESARASGDRDNNGEVSDDDGGEVFI